jgi:protein phosphatase methylesterase 1
LQPVKEVQDAPALVLLHGGGYSALSWSVFTKEITSIVHCQCLAIDFRGHGCTETNDDEDLSAETLATDIGLVLEKMFEDQRAPNFLIMGHS